MCVKNSKKKETIEKKTRTNPPMHAYIVCKNPSLFQFTHRHGKNLIKRNAAYVNFE